GSGSPQNMESLRLGKISGLREPFLRIIEISVGTDIQTVMPRVRTKRPGASISSADITCNEAPASTHRKRLWTDRSKVTCQVSANLSAGVRQVQRLLWSR